MLSRLCGATFSQRSEGADAQPASGWQARLRLASPPAAGKLSTLNAQVLQDCGTTSAGVRSRQAIFWWSGRNVLRVTTPRDFFAAHLFARLPRRHQPTHTGSTPACAEPSAGRPAGTPTRRTRAALSLLPPILSRPFCRQKHVRQKNPELLPSFACLHSPAPRLVFRGAGTKHGDLVEGGERFRGSGLDPERAIQRQVWASEWRQANDEPGDPGLQLIRFPLRAVLSLRCNLQCSLPNPLTPQRRNKHAEKTFLSQFVT